MTTLATNLHDRGYTCYRVQTNGVDYKMWFYVN
jgi:hypothetical protein